MNDPKGESPQTDPADQPGTSADLLPQVYDELRKLARARIAREPAGLTLQPTALVHEAYLRLIDVSRATCEARTQFNCALGKSDAAGARRSGAIEAPHQAWRRSAHGNA